jgi:hypothetical protein
LAFSYGRRIRRLSSSIFQPTVYSRRTSIFISFLSIFSLLSSVAAVQQQVVNQQQQRIPSSSSIISANGTTTTTTIFNPPRQRIQSTTITANDELINKTNLSQNYKNDTRSPARLVIIIIICSLMCGMTIVGNLVVILTVCLVRKLQTASNILIVSLAVSDIFVGLFIMPLAMGKFINNLYLIDISYFFFFFF